MNRSTLSNIVILFFAFCLLSFVTGCKDNPQKPLLEVAEEAEEEGYWLDDKQQNIVRNANDFSLKLFKKIAEDEGEKNVFVSTVGLLYSLSIINNGASGGTQQEICNAYFYADHPFVYIIQDPFGSYCFMGTFWGDVKSGS